jgi:hypothetical protein
MEVLPSHCRFASDAKLTCASLCVFLRTFLAVLLAIRFVSAAPLEEFRHFELARVCDSRRFAARERYGAARLAAPV